MDDAGGDGERVGEAVAGPGSKREFLAGDEFADANVRERERDVGATNGGTLRGREKVNGTGTGGDGAAIGIEKERGVLVNADSADTRRAGSENAGHESDGAAQAVARMEVRIGDNAAQRRNDKKIVSDDDLWMERIGERGGGREIGVVGLVVLRSVSEFAEDGEAGAGASHGNAAANGGVEFALNGRAAPEVDVVGLIATSDEDCRGRANGLRDEWIFGGVAAGNDKRGDGIFVAEILDVGIVSVGATGAYDEKIAARGARAKPLKRLVEIFAAADEGVASVRRDANTFRIADANVLVRSTGGCGAGWRG